MNHLIRNVTLLAALAWLVLVGVCFGQTDQVAVGVDWQVADGNGVMWTEPPYPPANGSMFFVDADAANDSADGRMGWSLSIDDGVYDHTGNGSGERLLTETGAFTSYTHTGGDKTDVIYVTNVSGGIATGYYVIASKVSNDAVTLEAASGLTADGVCDASSGPKQTPAAGNALCSDGTGDWLLFQRGDEWTITSTIVPKYGASASEPQVYGDYGSGVRPKIIADSCHAIRHVGQLNDVYFLSLHLESDKTVDESFNGIDIATLPDGHYGGLFEDLKIDGFSINIQVAAINSGGALAEDYTVRQCVLVNSRDGAGDSQGIYSVRTDGMLFDGNIWYHNGWTDDWEDTAILASGTTDPYTNGDTLTLACVRYGAFTARGEGDNLDVELVDTGGATTVTIVGDNIRVSGNFTAGIASNTVASAIQAYNGGADFTCTSSGTADLVAADAGIQNNVTGGGHSYNPSIFNHNIYLGNVTYNCTFRHNLFATASHMAMKVNTNNSTIIEHDNLITKCDRWGHIGNAAYEGGEWLLPHGSSIYAYNNACVESENNTNVTSNGATVKNALGGYFRNNFIGQRATAEGTGGNPLIVTGPDIQDGGDYTGVNDVVIDGNVIWDFHAPVVMQVGDDSGAAGVDGNESSGNTWSNNIVGNTGDDDQPLLETELLDSGVMVYSGTNWWSTQNTSNAWFDVGSAISTATWQSTYEATATFTNPTSGFTDPTRTSTTFATVEHSYEDWDAWIADCVAQRKGDHDPTILADAAIAYIFEGFGMKLYVPDSPPTPSGSKPILMLK